MCLRKSTVNIYSKYSGRSARTACRSGPFVLVQSIYGAIQEYGGFERPEWLG